jgi:hypothetical protein
MGLLTDFVAATREDALQYEAFVRAGNSASPDRFERCEYKNFTPLALELLWAVLRGDKEAKKLRRLEHIYHTGDGETWLERFPDDFVRLLSALDENAVTSVALVWADGNVEVPGNAAELEPVLRDLRRLAVQGRESGRSLYLWGSL